MRHFVIRFLKARSGATAIEYGLIAALVAAAVVVGLTAIGSSVNGSFNMIAGLFP